MTTKLAKLLLVVFCWLVVARASNAQFLCDVRVQNQDKPRSATLENFFLCMSHYGDVFTAAELENSQDFRVEIVFQRSTDGGSTWVRQGSGVVLPYDNWYGVRDIQQIDDLTAVAIGDTALILRTTDAGNSWQKQSLPGTVLFPAHISFANTKEGILSATDTAQKKNVLYTTSDGGEHWYQAPLSGLYLTYVKAYGDGKFRVVKSYWGTVYTTTDNFAHVDSTRQIFDTIATIDGHTRILGSCRFGNLDTIYLYGEDGNNDYSNGLIWRTTDAGHSWSEILNAADSLGIAYSMTDVDRDTILLARYSAISKIMISTDRGNSWQMDTMIFDSVDALHPETNAAHCHGLGVNSHGELVGAFGVMSSSLILGRRAQSSEVKDHSISTDFKVFPNPALDAIHTTQIIKNGGVIDALGRPLNVRSSASEYDVYSLPPGVYYISDGTHRARFVKE